MRNRQKGGQNQTPCRQRILSSMDLWPPLPGLMGNLLLGICAFFLIAVGVTPGEGGAGPANQAVFTIEVEPAPGPGAPSALFLRDQSQKLIKRLFPKEVAKSEKVFGKIKPREQPGEAQAFELQATFLYQKTYTAVNKRVIFAIRNDQAIVLSEE